jgi:hypothetical protein
VPHGQSEALKRIRASLPRLNDKEVRLAEVQYALAREHGYSSWRNLKRSEIIVSAPPIFQSRKRREHAGRIQPWQWSVTYTVRPEIHAELKHGKEYIVLASVLRRAPDKNPYQKYAELYERTIAIARGRVSQLVCPRGCVPDTQIRTQGGSVNARRTSSGHTFRWGFAV